MNLFETSTEPLPLDVERGEVPLRVVGLPRRGGGVYAVVDAVATARGGEHPPLPLPNVRRLGAAHADAHCPAVFATSFAKSRGLHDPEVTVVFGERADAPAGENTPRVVSMKVLATNRRLGGALRVGELAGSVSIGGHEISFRNITPASPYVPPPSGDAFALRVLRAARVTVGPRDLVAGLKDALYQSIPSWVGREEWVRSQELKIDALESLTASVGRHIGPEPEPDSGVQRGYAYRLVVDEAAFRGSGDLALFGATIAEALSRSLPVGAFVSLSLHGRRGTFEAVFHGGTQL